MEEKKVEIKIKVPEDVMKGIYANNVLISHTQGEFVMDFMTIFHATGIVGSRVIMSPSHVKLFIKALQNNIASYEQKFGGIKEAEEIKLPKDLTH